MDTALTLTVEEVMQLQREHQRMKGALARIRERAAADLDDLPDARTVPRTLAAGTLLALQGLAEAALE